MWKIKYLEDSIKKQVDIYAMSEEDAKISFYKRHPKGKILNIFYDSTESE